MAFRGTFDHTLDAKNRLTIPAKFRGALSDGVVLNRGSERCVEIWPKDEYERSTDRALAGHNPLSPSTRELKRRLNAGAFDTEVDGAGRVMIFPRLLEHAELGKDVAVIGAGEWLEVWDRGRWTAEDRESPARIRELTEDLDNPS